MALVRKVNISLVRLLLVFGSLENIDQYNISLGMSFSLSVDCIYMTNFKPCMSYACSN